MGIRRSSSLGDHCRPADCVGSGVGGDDVPVVDGVPSRSRAFWLGVAIIALACLVRLPTLTWHSLNFDEGASLHFSDASYQELFAHFADLSVDRHPLLYYILLKAWRQVAGDSDVMLRLPSAFAGILTVALVYEIGRRRLGEAAAGFAALLIVLSPLVVYQHQDARMYAPALLFATLAMGAFWELLGYGPHDPKLAVAAILCVALTLAGYTHVIAATLFPALGLSLIWTFCRAGFDHRRAAIYGMGTLGVSAVAYGPYVVNIFRKGGSGSGGASPGAWLRTSLGAVRTLIDYQAVVDFPGQAWCLLGLLYLIVIVGVWRSRRHGVMIALWFVSILALTIFVTLRIDFFQPKVFVFSAVPFAFLTALAAFGESGTFRWYGTLPALVVVCLALCGLLVQWRGERGREDFRHAAQFLQARAAPEDRVLVHVSWARFVFGHYYNEEFVHPFPNNVDSSTPVGDILQPYLDANVLWLVQTGVDLAGSAGDPDHRVQHWLSERYPVVTAVFPKGVDVWGYATRYRFKSLPDEATPVRAVYSNGLTLVGYHLPMHGLPSRDRWFHPPSTWVPVTLYWSVTQPLSAEVDISVSLEDEQGNVWGGELPREKDLRAFYAPLQWRPGEVVRWDFDVNTNPQVSPGTYKVVVRVYERDGGVPLERAGGEDWLILDRVCFSGSQP